LNEMGYDAFAIAASAEEALACAQAKCPDVVLMDIRIKGPSDGVQAADMLRKKFSMSIIYLTSHADANTVHRAKSTDPHGYLVKPSSSRSSAACSKSCCIAALGSGLA